jgi:hypothetical protein
MASGNTLCIFTASSNEPPVTNYATINTRNAHTILQFDATTQETALFTSIMPRNYAGGGVTVYVHWTAATATTGTIGWLVAFERMSDATTDLDTNSFATTATVTAATVPATTGVMSVTNVAITNGANMDSIAVGDSFRLQISRDVTNDTAAGDAELHAIEIKET